MKYQVSFLDITDMSDVRSDAHVKNYDWPVGKDCMYVLSWG